MKNKENYLLIIGYVFTLFFLEFFSRTIFAIASRSLNAYLYGFDNQVELNYKFGSRLNPRFTKIKNFPPQKNIFYFNKNISFTFGGSTTYGFNCGKNSSSWPNELSKISKLQIINYGRNGKNSFYALENLKVAMEERIPDKVFLANWINELNIIGTIPKSNVRKLSQNNGENIKMILKRPFSELVLLKAKQLDLSLKKYLLSYELLNNFKAKFFPNKKLSISIKRYDDDFLKQYGNDLISIAIDNYIINLKSFYEFSNLYGFKLIIIRPPFNWDLFSETYPSHYVSFVKKWDKLMIRRIRDLEMKSNFKFIEISDDLNNSGKKYFCDGVHQNLEGHKKTAEIINKFIY